MSDKELSKLLLSLPDWKSKEFVRKRVVTRPDIRGLKSQQLEAYDLMIDYVNGGMPDADMFLLEGYAGTGKTFVLNRLIETLLFEKGVRIISATAPTNKAVKVARTMAEYEHPNLQFQTIHQLLGLKPKILDSGQEMFVRDFDAVASIESTKVLILDEVSMLNDDLFQGAETKDYKLKGIAEYVQELGIKLIMVGDSVQIPPVGRVDCIPFTERGRRDFHIYRYILTEPVRQAIDSPIYNVTSTIRGNIHKHTALPDKVTNMRPDGIGVAFFDTGEYEQGGLFDDVLQTYFCSPNYKADADFIKLVGWRNKTVNKLNRIIRGLLYQEDAHDKLVVGEKLIANSPVVNDTGEYFVFTTSDEFVVRGYKVCTMPINNGQYQLQYYDCQVDYITLDGNLIVERIKVIHESSEVVFNNIVQALASAAMAAPSGSFKRIKAWEQFHLFKKTFADVTYNYAITAHKSQGSTYNNCIVLENDIDQNSNVVERNRIKYTAMSRPNTKLFIVH